MTINMRIPRVSELTEVVPVVKDQYHPKVNVDGEPIFIAPHYEELMKFAEAIKFEFKRYKFGLLKKDFKNYLHVYRDGDQYAMGMIAYADFRDTGESVARYTLFSPNIDNRKYGHGRRTNMAESVSIPRAMTNVRKYLRPLTTNQTVGLSYRDVNSAINHKLEEIIHAAKAVRDKVIHNDSLDVTSTYSSPHTMPKTDPLTNELKHLVESGYQFIDKELGEQLAELFKQRDIVTKAKQNARDNKWMFIETLKNFAGDVTFRISENIEINKWTMDHIPPENISTCKKEDLSEELKGKLSVLSMLEDGEFVEDVGYRVTSGAFYVL